MKGLTLHCGTNVATLDEVTAIATPEPTDTWFPIAHRTIRDLVVAKLENTGLRVVEEACGLWKNGLRAFGLLGLENGGPAKADYRLTIGWRNSHDQSFPAAGAIGSYVFVCDNLAFSGEITFARKHTRYVLRDLPQLIERATGRLVAARFVQDQRIGWYKQTELSNAQAHDIVIAALDARAVNLTRIPDVLAGWRTPAHDEFAPRTAWSLFNAFTEVEKGVQPFLLSKRTQALHGTFDRVTGLLAQAGVQRTEDLVASGHLGDGLREE